MFVLVTGGAGYIGSHTCVELLGAGHDIAVVDNYYNSKPEVLRRVRDLTGRDFAFYEADVLDRDALRSIFQKHPIDAVIHFAGLKAVGESVQKPLFYYYNNVSGTIALCEAMGEAGVKNLVFSSSATVYGLPKRVPLRESDPVDIETVTNPYGRTKLVIEQMLCDLHASDPAWNIMLLRYFNPIGAHESGRIGEDPNGLPNNLMPYIAQVAVGKLPILSVYGDDYPTPDGTGVRDYIHVVDLADGHVKALSRLREGHGIDAVNLGTGTGYSVLDIVDTFVRTTGCDVPYKIAPRRAGDIAECYADPAKAKELLGWEAKLDLARMCADTWRWQSRNPNGYDG